ncbi:MAG TPA: tripartite tricarboxylate transporter substrate binding protein [Eoetvoesiella sp.]
MKKIFTLAAVAAAFSLATPAMAASDFPSKPIEIIVPFSPSGATDLIARQIAEEMGKTLDQAIIVTNRPGASGAIGTNYVAKAAPDGYTLLLGVTTTHGINPTFNTKLGYDPVKDFTPISLAATMPHVLLVNPDSPAKTLADFIQAAKSANPSFAYGSAGEGSPQHLAGEMLKASMDFDAVHVPYKGGGPAIVDLIGGQIQFMSSGLSEAMPFITSNRLRALSVAASEPVPGLDVPTFEQAGHPFELTAWYAFFGPAGMPEDVTKKLNDAIAAAAKTDRVKAAFANLHVTPVGSTPQALAQHVENELARWSKAVQAAGVQSPL